MPTDFGIGLGEPASSTLLIHLDVSTCISCSLLARVCGSKMVGSTCGLCWCWSNMFVVHPKLPDGLRPDRQVALLRLQSLALDTKVCQTWTSRLPGRWGWNVENRLKREVLDENVIKKNCSNVELKQGKLRVTHQKWSFNQPKCSMYERQKSGLTIKVEGCQRGVVE